MQITFIGGGNMAAAMIGGLGQVTGQTIRVVDRNPDRLRHLAQMFGVLPLTSIPDNFIDDEIVVLAVKPQSLQDAAIMLRGKLDKALVMSIVTGVQMQALSRWLGTARIVRAMPNTPSMVGKGATGLYANTTVSAPDRKIAETIMTAVGKIFWLENERAIDDVTCVSGSGPAYVFYFIEAMLELANRLGFDAAVARDMVLTTFEGAVELARTGADVGQLRANVTSKGGSTERTIAFFDASGVKSAIIAGALEGRARAVEIGQQLSQE